MDCPANCLQPLGQNDNGWNQGQLFFTPDQPTRIHPANATIPAASQFIHAFPPYSYTILRLHLR